ncbi:MAG: hypothetical protein ACRC10_01190 [Thermoguttaceae bacterium]
MSSVPTFQILLGIAGLTLLVLIARYVLNCIKRGMTFVPPTKEEHLVEFERMMQKGAMNRLEFMQIKHNLSQEIVERTKREQQHKSLGLPESANVAISAASPLFQAINEEDPEKQVEPAEEIEQDEPAEPAIVQEKAGDDHTKGPLESSQS